MKKTHKIKLNELKEMVKSILNEDHLDNKQDRINFIKKNLNKLSEKNIEDLYLKTEKFLGK